MTYENFKETLYEDVRQALPSAYHVKVQQILKNNGLHKDALIIQEPNQNVAPSLYLNEWYQFYQNGTQLHTITEKILSLYQKHRLSKPIDLSGFRDFSKVKSNIVFHLINYEQNRELLQTVPFVAYLDLAITFHYLLLPGKEQQHQGCSSILISRQHLDTWNVTSEELYQIACKNTPRLLPHHLHNLNELVNDYMIHHSETESFPSNDPCETDSDFPMYVLTNQTQLYGAGCMLYPQLLSRYASWWQTNLYIIPSSIHEVLLIPANERTLPEELEKMVREVNATQVAQEEILSNRVYLFSRTTKQLMLCS